MKLSSTAFDNEGVIPRKYTCNGAGINPPLSISDIPPSTACLVLIMDDPDVPTYLRKDGMFDHWIVFNIPPDTKEIEEGKEPRGLHGVTTNGMTKYYGPNPPNGEHRYFFKLYALDTMLSISEKSTKQQVEKAMTGHILAESILMGVYGK